MNKPVKIALISLGIMIGAYFVYTVISFTMSITSTFKSVSEMKSYSDSDEDIIQYVKDTHEVDVIITDNRGSKNFHNGGGATVKTDDEHNIVFEIYIGYLGKVTGDNYVHVSNVYFLNDALQMGEDVKALEKSQAYSAAIQPPYPSDLRADMDPVFYFSINEALEFHEEETLQILDDVIQVAKKWKKIAAEEYDVSLDKIEMEQLVKVENDNQFIQHLIILTIDDMEYESLVQLGDQLAQQNPNNFSLRFLPDIMDKVDPIESQLNGLQFTRDTLDHYIECVDMKTIDKCENFEIKIEHEKGEDVDSKIDFRYDDPKVKEDLLHAIQLLNDLNLPINQIEIRKLYQPSNIAEDQLFTEEELSDIREERVHFRTENAIIRNLNHITTIEDIVFE